VASLRDGMEALLAGAAPVPPAARLIGFALRGFADGEATVELEAGEPHTNPMGTVQGGVLSAMADAAMGWAYMTTLREGETYTTLEMKINFLKPVWQGRVVATGRVRRAGRTTALVECEVVDGKGSAVAYATSTCMLLSGAQAAGR
jgi:uncharacterized protein (TIGR00369 family)